MLGSASSSSLILLPVIAFVVTVVAAFAIAITFKGVRGQAAATLQSDTITALEAANGLKADEIKTLQTQVTALEKRGDDLQKQVDFLTDAITKAAKVELLRNEVDQGFKHLDGKLDMLLAH